MRPSLRLDSPEIAHADRRRIGRIKGGAQKPFEPGEVSQIWWNIASTIQEIGHAPAEVPNRWIFGRELTQVLARDPVEPVFTQRSTGFREILGKHLAKPKKVGVGID